MSDDDVDYDLLDFMRAHMNGNASHVHPVETSTGVLEGAEYVCDVSRRLCPNLRVECIGYLYKS
jgi:hypothetical protein